MSLTHLDIEELNAFFKTNPTSQRNKFHINYDIITILAEFKKKHIKPNQTALKKANPTNAVTEPLLKY